MSRTAAMKAVLEAAADNFFVIGITQGGDKFGIAKTNMKNVFEPLPVSGALWAPAPATAQMYFDR